jgi:hypothetical protein
MAHYFSNPLSVFTSDASHDDDALIDLTPHLADQLRLVPSFQDGVDRAIDSPTSHDLGLPPELISGEAGVHVDHRASPKRARLEAQVDVELLSDDDRLFASIPAFRRAHRCHSRRRCVSFHVLLTLQDAWPENRKPLGWFLTRLLNGELRAYGAELCKRLKYVSPSSLHSMP